MSRKNAAARQLVAVNRFRESYMSALEARSRLSNADSSRDEMSGGALALEGGAGNAVDSSGGSQIVLRRPKRTLSTGFDVTEREWLQREEAIAKAQRKVHKVARTGY